jgi:hypothetical protein
VSNIVSEILLRLLKALAAGVLAAMLYVILVGLFALPGSPELLLLAWLSAAAFILLVQDSPI